MSHSKIDEFSTNHQKLEPVASEVNKEIKK